MNISFTEVIPEHLSALAEILNYYVANTTVTFHTETVSVDDMKGKLFFDQPWYRSYTILNGDSVIGYCAVSQWKKQEAYRHTAEVNIYLDHNCTGKNVGTIALKHLEKFALQNKISTLIAGLCIENYPSKRVFEKNGYEHCAHFKNVGVKFGRVLDVIYLQKQVPQ